MCKSLLPNHKVAGEACDLIGDSGVEFIQLLASESLDLATKEGKQKVTGAHVLQACESLGFGQFIADMQLVSDQLVSAVSSPSTKLLPVK